MNDLTFKNARSTVNSICFDVLIALTPIVLWAVFLYGFRVLTLILCGVVSAVLIRLLSSIILKKKEFTLFPVLSAAIVTLCLPASAPLYLPIIACAVGEMISVIFSFFGRCYLSPSAVSVLICHLAFPKIMDGIPQIFTRLHPFKITLGSFEKAPASSLQQVLDGPLPENDVTKVFFGFESSMMGQVSAFLILAGGVYLMFRRIIKPLPTVIFASGIGLGTYFMPTLYAASDLVAFKGAMYNVLGMGTLFCIIYLASDPRSRAKTTAGAIISALIGAAVTFAVRYYLYPQISVLCGVLAFNIASAICDKFLIPMQFGGRIKNK